MPVDVILTLFLTEKMYVNLQMPNMRQMAKRERKTRKWTPEAMEQAMQEVEAGRLTCRQAAKRFGVPKSSLNDRVSGRVASDCVHSRGPLLTPADENSLVEYCLYSASHGFPLTKPQVLAHALGWSGRHRGMGSFSCACRHTPLTSCSLWM